MRLMELTFVAHFVLPHFGVTLNQFNYPDFVYIWWVEPLYVVITIVRIYFIRRYFATHA